MSTNAGTVTLSVKEYNAMRDRLVVLEQIIEGQTIAIDEFMSKADPRNLIKKLQVRVEVAMLAAKTYPELRKVVQANLAVQLANFPALQIITKKYDYDDPLKHTLIFDCFVVYAANNGP